MASLRQPDIHPGSCHDHSHIISPEPLEHPSSHCQNRTAVPKPWRGVGDNERGAGGICRIVPDVERRWAPEFKRGGRNGKRARGIDEVDEDEN